MEQILNMQALVLKHQMEVKGVIHIGAHYGQENVVYDDLNFPNRAFFEPLSSNFAILSEKIKEWPLYNLALGSAPGKAHMYVEHANAGMSSSLLKPQKHLEQYPHITFPDKEEVTIDTLDNVIVDPARGFNGFEQFKQSYNFINIDVQGYELEVFRGAREALKYIDYIMTEVNNDEVYENCAKVEELNEFLGLYNFEMAAVNWVGGTWGDAFYIKTS